jgi:hypothetical protein
MLVLLSSDYMFDFRRMMIRFCRNDDDTSNIGLSSVHSRSLAPRSEAWMPLCLCCPVCR